MANKHQKPSAKLINKILGKQFPMKISKIKKDMLELFQFKKLF